jgi:hypothetical protein
MLATFCLRLACGLAAGLLLFPPRRLNPRFYRAQLLTVLGLTAAAAVFLRGAPGVEGPWPWAALGGGALMAFLGSLSWSLEGAPAGRTLVALTAGCLAAGLALLLPAGPGEAGPRWPAADHLTSAALLGAATTGMLVGHSYLTAPAMSLAPLFRSLGALLVALLARGTLCGIGLWSWTSEHPLAKLDEVTLLLPLRWALGLVGPLVLGAMAWQTAKIRSTQSATGILYVVVILVFLGELFGQLLAHMTGLTL